MNWEAIGAIGEIVGAIAVIATLGYLAYQIKEQTKQYRSAATRERGQRISDSLYQLADSEHLVPAFLRMQLASGPRSGAQAIVDLTGNELEDASRYSFHRQATLQSMQTGWLDQHLGGPQRDATLRSLRAIIDQDGKIFEVWWGRLKTGFVPEFVEAVDATLEKRPAGGLPGC